MVAEAATVCGAFGEAVVFLRYFVDLPDPRQRGKVIYPLDEVLLLSLLAVLAGRRRSATSPASATISWGCCGDSGRFGTVRRRMITSATSSPRWMQSSSSAASSPGSLP